MRKIVELPKYVVSQIAAGEVIERPAYCVKELVENSIDAGATSIQLFIKNSGLQNITIIDNGEGIEKEDLDVCFQPHSTSKIHTFEDLQNVSTLGFRGEALASIAAISKMTINSRAKSDLIGNSVTIQDGKASQIIPFGMPVGTKVSVDNLFSSVPARKKFIKSPQREFRHILEIFIAYALSYPTIHFVFTHNKKTLFDLPPSIDKKDRILWLFGNEIAANLLPFSYDDAYLHVDGFLTRPQIAAKTISKQYLFINNRFIYDRALVKKIKSAYGTLLPKQSHPPYFLFFTMQLDMVDVNVHPRKEEVRFFHKEQVYSIITQLVAQTLAKENLLFRDVSWDAKPSTHFYTGNLLQDEQLDWELPKIQLDDEMEPIQVDNLYIVSQQQKGILLVDQHAAHERILYEQFLELFLKNRKKNKIYHLPESLIIEVSVVEKELLQEKLQKLALYGFEIEHYKDKLFVLSAVPQLFYDLDYKSIILSLLQEDHFESGDAIDAFHKKMISYLACRRAVKAGDTLEKEQMRELLNKLESVKNNVTCPHGRPTKIFIDKFSLEKMFRRK